MTQPLIVCSPCTRTTDAGTLGIYREQLAKAGIPHYVELLSGCPPLGWGMSTFLDLCREWCHQFAEYDFIVLTDAFDVTFYGGCAADVISRIPTDRCLLAAEKNCYPDPSLRERILANYPDRGEACFFNGGLTAGTPANILAYCDAIERHPKYNPSAVNQWLMNELLADGEELGQLDYRSQLFFNLFGGYAELDFVNREPVNRKYDTWPLFVHASGHWSADEMWTKYKASIA